MNLRISIATLFITSPNWNSPVPVDKGMSKQTAIQPNHEPQQGKGRTTDKHSDMNIQNAG